MNHFWNITKVNKNLSWALYSYMCKTMWLLYLGILTDKVLLNYLFTVVETQTTIWWQTGKSRFWTQNSKRRMCTLISAVLSDIYCWTIFRMEKVMININSNENCKSLPSLKSNYKRMISSVLSEISFQTTSKWNLKNTF